MRASSRRMSAQKIKAHLEPEAVFGFRVQFRHKDFGNRLHTSWGKGARLRAPFQLLQSFSGHIHGLDLLLQ